MGRRGAPGEAKSEVRRKQVKVSWKRAVTLRGVCSAPGWWVTGGSPSPGAAVSGVTPASSLELDPGR